MILLAHDENGKPTKAGEKVASKVIKGVPTIEDGKTKRLAQFATGKTLPITIGAYKPPKPVMRIKAQDLLIFQVVNNLTDSVTKHLATHMAPAHEQFFNN